MNATLAESRRWSKRQWSYAIVSAGIAQVALILFFGGRPQAPLASPRFNTDVYSAVDPWSAQQLAQLPTLNDPALFALPSLQGFSGSAWLTFAPPEHRLNDWTEPARWLALNPTWLADRFAHLAAGSSPAPLLIADKPLPRPTGLDVPVPNAPLATQSDLHVEGELAQRPLLAPLELRSWPPTEPLTNTIVQLLVDATGRPLTATLLTESGSKEADQYALAQAKSAQFEPLRRPKEMSLPDPRLSWGKLVFQWAALPPAATNGAAARP